MTHLRRAVLSALLALSAAAAFAGAPAFAPTPAPRPDAGGPDALTLAAEAGLSGVLSYLVIDAETGEALEGGDIDRPLPPASVAKAPTALFALDTLGPDHRFETRLIAVGALENGVLAGDLVLQGGGDPETDSAALDLLAFHLAEAGLKRVNGRFLIDDSLLPLIERIDATQPEVAAYNPAVGALNLNFNRVFAEWRRAGGKERIAVEARGAGLSPPTEAVTVEIVDKVALGPFDYLGAADDGPEKWRVARGALGASGGRWLPVRRPGLYAGEMLHRFSADAGVELPEPSVGAAPLVSDVLARVESRPLADILAGMLRYSTNLTAEAVGMAAAKAGGASAESLAASAAAMNVWAAGFAGFPAGDPGFQLLNHSGLSPDSRASARRLADILLAADRRGFPALDGGRAAKLKGLLPQVRYLDDGASPPPIEASIRAKSGTLNFVSALAGYIEPEAGRRLIFVILSADLDARAAIADVKDESPPGARAWAARARRLQRALIRSWITRFAAP
ncbi:D-alanyl-D-alanine carboxypeptidase/D-alanyl-D-alanine-endopeptidase [Pikeienuella sp. HZG-20]|uniref:D-alanyl-D-alanine carboxypeptidase/D-alanyl-D-alanine endopeptidase n=1 Tax=Paludibacillus litoralis TaxID=3133267 RepID=UPI0030EE6ADD